MGYAPAALTEVKQALYMALRLSLCTSISWKSAVFDLKKNSVQLKKPSCLLPTYAKKFSKLKRTAI